MAKKDLNSRNVTSIKNGMNVENVKEKDKDSWLNIPIPGELRKHLKLIATQDGLPMKTLVTETLQEYVQWRHRSEAESLAAAFQETPPVPVSDHGTSSNRATGPLTAPTVDSPKESTSSGVAPKGNCKCGHLIVHHADGMGKCGKCICPKYREREGHLGETGRSD